MHGYPVMQFVQYSVPPLCWVPQHDPHRAAHVPPPTLGANRSGSGIKKYVIWCLICGGFSCLLGILFLGVYFLLHSYTITVGNFETVPTFVPATLLILTGLCVMSLARRKNRYSYLIKLSGACGLISALTCALVTVTTTVLHMSRLQALRECEYAQKSRTCTCYSDIIDTRGDMDRGDKGIRLVFDSLSDCGVVHGSLYSCLRAIFGLSVAGVLIAVFSCMLVYQLLSHERKKMYWEQLELRCRSLYTSQHGPHPNIAPANPRNPICRCCEQCHAHRQLPLQTAVYPWDDSVEPRFWNGQPSGNFYSPNPGTDDINVGPQCRAHATQNARSRSTGWSWPRMPWQRNSPDSNSRCRQTPSSPDSQYGFSNSVHTSENITNQEDMTIAPRNNQAFNIVSNYGVWGPPPPYSDPNSPARRGYYQYIQPNSCTNSNIQPERTVTTSATEQHIPCQNHRSTFQEQRAIACSTQVTNARNMAKNNTGSSVNNFKAKVEYENGHSDDDVGGSCDRFSNTLPTRKVKRRIDAGHKSIGHNANNTAITQRINVQQVFNNSGGNSNMLSGEPSTSDAGSVILSSVEGNSTGRIVCKQNRHQRIGVENSGFQSINGDRGAAAAASNECEPAESEVYFADVSSCCNISVKNDNFYDEANQRHHNAMQHHQHHHHQHQNSNCSHSSSANEDYLAQRFGKRENSKRSRLPFPQIRNDDYNDSTNSNNTRNISIVPNTNQMQKEISRQSVCSTESEAKTEFTDLSPSTPCGNKFVQSHIVSSGNNKNNICESNDIVRPPANFVATFPFSSESQSLEAHRRSTKNVQQELMLAPEAHYEIINENNCDFPKTTGVQKSVRPTNLVNTKHNEFIHKTKPKSKSRERLDVSDNFKSDIEWSEDSVDSRQHL